ncbi:MAG: hypothetical protein IJV68_03255, partial [Clostridia bacterium]|nr:hypothetical protein [Clostridia bacterium]
AAKEINADTETAINNWLEEIQKNKNEYVLYTGDKVTIEGNYTKAIEDALEYLVKTLYNDGAKAIDKVEGLVARYEKGIADIKMFNDNDIYTEAARADLKAMLDDVADEYELVKPVSAELRKTIKDSYDALVAVLPKGTEVVEFKLSDYVEVESEGEAEEDTAEGEDTEGKDAEGDAEDAEDESSESASKYVVAENKIVYEVYSNGTAFILNFNNYSVLVKIDGINYFVDAYGYKMLNNVKI